MLHWSEIEARIREGESDATEFKRWDAFPDKVAEAIAAFSNTSGGLLVLGVADDGTIAGVPGDPREVQERLTNLLQTGLSVPVGASLGWHATPNGVVHWIEVRRYRGPEPLRARRRVLVRRGRASVEPSPAELQELYNAFGFVLTEEQLVPGATPSDLDLDVFEDFLVRQGLDVQSDPQPEPSRDRLNRGVTVLQDGAEHVTLYGLLCFGRQPQSFPPTRSAWVEPVAYAGVDRAADVLLRGEAKGRLDEQVDRVLGWLRALGTREEYGDVLRKDVPLVPVRALRELVVNAVAHRDYAILGSRVLVEVFSDRIDVTSPGELPNHMTGDAAMAGGHPRSRNESIAHFLALKGYMEARGRGLPIVRREMRAFNGTEPVLVSSRDGRFVRVTLRLRA